MEKSFKINLLCKYLILPIWNHSKSPTSLLAEVTASRNAKSTEMDIQSGGSPVADQHLKTLFWHMRAKSKVNFI